MAEKLTEEAARHRKPKYDIHAIFVNRWSPRAMSGEPVQEDEFMALFEAARWAPSSYNGQLWRFIYAKKGTKDWEVLFDLLVEGNKAWAKNAAVLVCVISRKNFEFNEKPSVTHVFDAGAAWENLALEGARRGLVIHGMEGFDYGKAKKMLEVPENYDVCAMFAIGKRGKKEDLPEQTRKMEFPNDRRPIEEILFEGKFNGSK